ncbi:MAG: hypothetical protein AAGJ96_06060 [Pseudomonadota bacterium]
MPPLTKDIAAHLIRANALRKDHKHAAAVPFYAAFLEHQPDHVEALAAQGANFLDLHDADNAERAFTRLLQIMPSHIGALNGIASVHARRFDMDHALQVAAFARDLYPEKSASLGNYAAFLSRAGRHAEALAELDKALEIDPWDTTLRKSRGLMRLMVGEYAGGYEDRTRPLVEYRRKPGRRLPIQTGDMTGRWLAITPDEGNGDCVAMMRFLPQVRSTGARVRLAARSGMARLWEASADVEEHIAAQKDYSDSDCMLTILSLPAFFGTSVETVPPPARLKAPRAAQERAARITAPHKDKLKIGICWAGSNGYVVNYARSVGFERFLPLTRHPQVQLFSLYKGELSAAFEADSDAQAKIVDAGRTDADFADAFALIEAMDLIITVDTCILHLAGASNTETWGLIQHAPYYYFQPQRADGRSAWYPDMRLIRQPRDGDWDSVFAQVDALLTERLAEWSD